jgi:hypothetical protein
MYGAPKNFSFLSFYQITVIENQACTQEDRFIPTKGMEDLNKLNNENSHCVQDLNLKFYTCALEHLNLWEESSDGAPIFNWINLYFVPEWNEIEKAYYFAVSEFREMCKRIRNRDYLFDEFCLVKMFVEEGCSKWRQKDSTFGNIRAEIFTYFSTKKLELRISSL